MVESLSGSFSSIKIVCLISYIVGYLYAFNWYLIISNFWMNIWFCSASMRIDAPLYTHHLEVEICRIELDACRTAYGLVKEDKMIQGFGWWDDELTRHVIKGWLFLCENKLWESTSLQAGLLPTLYLPYPIDDVGSTLVVLWNRRMKDILQKTLTIGILHPWLNLAKIVQYIRIQLPNTFKIPTFFYI